MNWLEFGSCVLVWLVVGFFMQNARMVMFGLYFGYQYSKTPLEYFEFFCMVMIATILWPLGGHALTIIDWIGKALRLKHYQ